jgi:hypothetical protein
MPAIRWLVPLPKALCLGIECITHNILRSITICSYHMRSDRTKRRNRTLRSAECGGRARVVASQGTFEPENAGQDLGRDRSGRFIKGRSGNAAGKPQGTRDRATIAAETLLAGEAKALTRKVIELALKGDVQALRICIDRILPARRGSPVRVPLPEIKTGSDVTAALSAVTAAIGRGELTTDEAGGIASVIEAARKTIELVEIERRLARLEQSAGR